MRTPVENKPLTSKNMPQDPLAPRNPRMPEELQDSIIARPLTLPDFANIRPKPELNIEFRWGNYAVPTKEGVTTLRLDQLMAAGFVYARPEDVQGDCPKALIRDGKIRYGDVVCLKIDKASYQGALKWNWERAVRRGTANAVKGDSTARGIASSTIAQAGAPPDLTKKLSVFQPSDAEVAALTNEKKDQT